MKSFQILAYALLIFASSGAFAATDLDLDPGFGANGSIFADFTNGLDSNDRGLRSFRECDKITGQICRQTYHYNVVGVHQNNGFHMSPQDLIIIRVSETGVPDEEFAPGGKLTVPAPYWMVTVNDVAFDPATERLYFAGTEMRPIEGYTLATVFCLDLYTRAGCAGFGDGAGLSSSGERNGVATRVTFGAGYLYVAGYIGGLNGNELQIAKLYASSGSTVGTFGDAGGIKTVVLGDKSSGQNVHVYGMTLSANGAWLYVVGDYDKTTGDYDGFAYSLTANTGAFNHLRAIAYEGDNLTLLGNDSVTAIAALANGDVAVAGWSDDVSGYRQLLLARLSPSLAFDAGFCGAGVCVKQVGGWFGWTETFPSALGERPNTRDLVVGMHATVPIVDYLGGPTQHVQEQIVQQYSANGGVLHDETDIKFPAYDATTLVVRSAGMTVTNERVELVGSRAFSSSPGNVDVTMTRLLANDTIFADQFGGSTSD